MRRNNYNVFVGKAINNWELVSGMTFAHQGVNYIVNVLTEFPERAHVINGDLAGVPDLIICDGPLGRLPQDIQLTIPRFTKSFQAAMLKKSFEKSPDDYGNMRLIPTWSTPGNVFGQHCEAINGMNYPMVLRDYADYVIKPDLGAKSTGQVVFNTNKHSAVEVVCMVRGQNNPQTERLVKSDDPNVQPKDAVEERAKDKSKTFFGMDKFPEGIKVYVGNEYPEKVDDYFMQQALVIQEVIKDISAEFRIIVGENGIDMMLVRPRGAEGNSGDYKAVTCDKDKLILSSSKGPSAFADIGGFAAALSSYCGFRDKPRTEKVHNIIAPEVALFISRNMDYLRYNSVDLFLTTSGQWGIFEFCNQFNTNDMGQTAATQMHQRWALAEISKRM